uniref:Uncharacterized protein n=1 Tax=Solanum tuberosum TaxID=4113 RepID=M1DRG4_SOLTU
MSVESFFALGHLSTFVELELAFEASIVSLRIFGYGNWIEEQSKDTNFQKGTKQADRRKKRDRGDRQVHLASRRVAM